MFWKNKHLIYFIFAHYKKYEPLVRVRHQMVVLSLVF